MRTLCGLLHNPSQITQRLARFEKIVTAESKEISVIGNAAWDPIKETTETPASRSSAQGTAGATASPREEGRRMGGGFSGAV